MKRNLSFVGTILSTIANGILVIISVISLIIVFGIIAGISGQTGSVQAELMVAIISIGISLLMLALVLAAFILSCKMFKYINATHEDYTKKKSSIISVIVLNFLVMILCILSMDPSSVGTFIFYLICMLVLLASNILFIIDLAQENKKVEAMVARPVEESTSNAESTNNTQEQANQEETKTETEVKEESEENNEEK